MAENTCWIMHRGGYLLIKGFVLVKGSADPVLVINSLSYGAEYLQYMKLPDMPVRGGRVVTFPPFLFPCGKPADSDIVAIVNLKDK